jgi:hypothetical protein
MSGDPLPVASPVLLPGHLTLAELASALDDLTALARASGIDQDDIDEALLDALDNHMNAGD